MPARVSGKGTDGNTEMFARGLLRLQLGDEDSRSACAGLRWPARGGTHEGTSCQVTLREPLTEHLSWSCRKRGRWLRKDWGLSGCFVTRAELETICWPLADVVLKTAGVLEFGTIPYLELQ